MSKSNSTDSVRIASWVSRGVAIAILATAIPAKFTGGPGAVSVFEQLGAEPVGRLATGVFEAIALILLIVPRSAGLGGLFGAGLMVGAVSAHLMVLGIAVDGDPSMFLMATAALLACSATAWLRRHEIPIVGDLFVVRRVVR